MLSTSTASIHQSNPPNDRKMMIPVTNRMRSTVAMKVVTKSVASYRHSSVLLPPFFGRKSLLQHHHPRIAVRSTSTITSSVTTTTTNGDDSTMASSSSSSSLPPRDVMMYDVCIVGGGPAGLSAAIRIKQLCQQYAQHKQISVCVIDKGR